METRIIDTRITATVQHNAAVEPAVPHTRQAGAVGNQKPMNPENPSAGLPRSARGTVASQKALPNTVEEANLLARSFKRGVSFALDSDSGQVVVLVTNEDTGEIIRQIPSEEFLEMVSRVQEVTGLFFDEVA